MKVSIFGLGYVGAVTAGCLAELGHVIIGADVQQEMRVELVLRPAAKDVGRATLGGTQGLRLGWTSWLRPAGGDDAAVSPTRLALGAVNT